MKRYSISIKNLPGCIEMVATIGASVNSQAKEEVFYFLIGLIEPLSTVRAVNHYRHTFEVYIMNSKI